MEDLKMANEVEATPKTEDPKIVVAPVVDRATRELAQLKLTYAIMRFYDTHPLYYAMLSSMPRKEMPEIQTMGVGFLPGSNFVTLFYSPKFVAERSEDFMRFVLDHECQHVGLRHIARMGGKHQKVANLAADVIVNSNIPGYLALPKEEQIGITQDKIPALANINVRESTMEEIYNILMQSHDEMLEKIKEMIEKGELTMDDHGMWGNQPTDKDGNPIEGLGESLSPEQNAALDTLMKEAAKKLGGRDPGNVPGDIRREIEELRKSKLDWRKVLSIFAQSIVKDDKEPTWKRRNRRFGVVAPGKRKEFRPNILVVVDNSGSVSGPLYDLFMSQVLTIADHCEVLDVIGVDTRVNCEFTIKNKKLPEGFDLSSGGGTDFQPAFDYAHGKKYNAVIYLTDGCASHDINTHGIPALFAICPQGQEVGGYRNIKIED